MTLPDRAPFSDEHTPPSASEGNNRVTGRLRPGNLTCDIGKVMDISSGGMRIRCRGKPKMAPGQLFPTHVHAPGGHIRLICHVVWRNKIRFRRWELGLRFVDMTPELRSALSVLAAGIVRESDLSRQEAD